LQFTDGEPVALLTGTARPIEHSDKAVTVFTNAVGRFGAEGLAPGRWILEMATDGAPTRFVLDIPTTVEGLFKAGTLHPEEAP
jgi:outer membrane usher protein